MSAVSKAFQVNDDAVKHLLRQVVYMFYPHQSIIIMEAILFHNVLFEDDLIKLCCMHKKVFRSFCNKLMEDKLIVAHTQKEETQPYKLFTRTYYYVHSIEAIDSIKWKIHTIVKHVKEEIGNFSEPQGYICPTCHHKYTLLDAASLLTDDRLNFECSICGDYLIDDDISQEQKKGQEKLERLMSLVEPIIKYLKIVDDLKIEDNNFDTTLIKYVPAFSDSLALYSVSTRTSARRKKLENNNTNLSDASKRSQATIHVSITADDEDLKRERQKREDRNKKLRQNALPSWHQESTVGKAALGRLDLEEEEDEDADLIQQQDQENPANPAQPDNDDGTTTTSATTANTIQDNSTLINSTDGTNVAVKGENGQQAPDSSTSPVKTEQPAISDTDSTMQLPVKAEQTAEPSNTAPMASVQMKEESAAGSSTKPSTASTFMSTTSDKTAVPASATEGTTAEELDALSAYYSQLRQRQAAEEEEEEDEDEEEEEEDNADGMDIDAIDEEDVDNMDAFNDEAENGTAEAVKPTQTTDTTDVKPTADDTKQADDSINKDDLDEEDFDLDMFASDED